MKKFAFAILCIVSLGFLFRILGILIFDFSRLTAYGFGYLTGTIVLFLLFAFLSFVVGKSIFKSSS